MARVVRKVSGKAVRGQKKGILYNKNFWIGISCGVVAILALVLGLVFGLRGGSTAADEVKVDDYFAQPQVLEVQKLDAEGNPMLDENNKPVVDKYDVNFEKASYASVVMHTNPNANSSIFVEYTFVFATDLSKFYPKSLMNDGTDMKNAEHEAIFNALMILQHAIDEHNKLGNDYKVKLYIVDTQDNKASDNMSILTDQRFTGGASEATTILSLVNGDKLIKNFTTEDGKEKNLLATSLNKSEIQTVVNNAKLFINANFKDNK